MNSDESHQISSETEINKPVFKKPLLIGKVGKFPKKVIKENREQKADDSSIKKEEISEVNEAEILKGDETSLKNEDPTEDKQLPLLHKDANEDKQLPYKDVTEDKHLPPPYKEPVWSGIPETMGKEYKLEVLKSGSIIDTIDLMTKSFWLFGRLANCDIHMAHPTISRYHAVLQYRSVESEDQPKGFYLYDLSSTHGTFLNKNKLKSRSYVKVYVGHLVKLGLSSRSYLLTGPESDTEEENELSVTDLKKKRQEELARREEAEKEAIRKREEEQEAMQKKLEERGIDWGLGEDADEESDLSENPFAQTNNEELYLDDPKKALRGFMEREGHDLEYDCTEQGMGQFLCKVELPLDDEFGKPIVAEVLHKGKKKEAVVQCALEACRILDRYGLLRQATHESRKRKAKNWEENDFYDSDEDTFLDRTGTIEKKRENRMKIKMPTKPETYQSLLEKETALRKQIGDIERELRNSGRTSMSDEKSKATDEDSLDNYMKELKQMKLDKQTIAKLKSDLSKLKQDLANVVKLVNIAKPAQLPTLIQESPKKDLNENKLKNKLPIFGKRLKIKVQLPERKESSNSMVVDDNEEEEEEDVDDEVEDAKDGEKLKKYSQEKLPVISETVKVNEDQKVMPTMTNEKKYIVSDSKDKLLSEFSKIDASFKIIFPLMSEESERCLRDIWSKMTTLPEYSELLPEDTLSLSSGNASNCKFTPVLSTFTKEIDLISAKLKSIGSAEEILEMARKLSNLAKEMTLTVNRLEQSEDAEEDCEKMMVHESGSEIDSEKKKKKNQRRIQQRQERAEIEKRKGYEEDAVKEDYNMWVPPEGQTGDGKTCLNDKYGY